jgi:hypothetical protein
MMALCHGAGCNRREACLRWRTPPTPERQVYAEPPPRAANGACPMWVPIQDETPLPSANYAATMWARYAAGADGGDGASSSLGATAQANGAVAPAASWGGV